MANQDTTSRITTPSYIVGPEGEPTGVILDMPTWLAILTELEDHIDLALWHEHAAEIQALARGERPAGWLDLTEFERELDEAEARGELPS
jgi:hypothetical protein